MKMTIDLQVGPGVSTPGALLVRVGAEWVEMPATVTPLGEALRQLCDDELARLADDDVPEHISRWNEIEEIAAAAWDADPHGDTITWRDEFEIPF
jgi:hypothetical protein